MKTLPFPDNRFAEAAEGWIELGNYEEAARELRQISEAQRLHPDVLHLEWNLLAHAKEWKSAVKIGETHVALAGDDSRGWKNLCFALHEEKRTQEAYKLMKPVSNRFKEDWLVHYNLACYACQLGKLEEAKEHLGWALGIGNAEVIKGLALKDLDLEPLWGGIKES